jgi:hypothetical protein
MPYQMPKKRDDFDDYADEYGEEALEELMELLGEYPELDEYLDSDWFESLDDADFYGSDAK